jgi:transcriptional regulator GlxA family with amidase domain
MDVVVVPGLETTSTLPPSSTGAWAPWLAKWHADGATITASCSGTFLLAEAGLLDGRTATTHWLYAAKLAQRYPRVNVATQRLLIDHGDVITSGGATTFLDLAIYIVERFGGVERPNAAARMLLIDRDRHSQLPYAVSAGNHRLHRNELVHRAQDHIADRLGTDLRAGDVAAAVGVSERTLVRHFRAELSASVQAQIRHNGSKPPSVPSKPATHPSTTSEGPSATATAHHSGGPSTRRPDSLLKASGASSPGTEPGGRRAADLVDGESRRLPTM